MAPKALSPNEAVSISKYLEGRNLALNLGPKRSMDRIQGICELSTT